MTSEPFLSLTGLRRHFGATRALDGADLALHAGSIHALVGENGAGKSTLIQCLSGLYQPDEGAIRIDGREQAIDGPRQAEALGFRFIHQELNLVPHFDAVGNAWIGRRHPRLGPFLDRRQMRRDVAAVARRIAPDLPLDRAAIRLTPGQRQMAEIVRALMSPARLVVMDEPTSSLSEGEAERLHQVVRQLAAEGCAVLFISHRLDEITALCDRYTVLRNGRTVGSGAMADTDRGGLVALMSGGSEKPLADAALSQPSPPMWGRVGEGGAGSVSPDAPANNSEPLSPSPALPHPDLPHKRGGTGTVLFAVDLAFAGGRMTFAAHAGEIVGLYGLIGAGRSSLLKMIWGASRLDGTIRIDGRALRRHSPAASILAGIAYVPEDRRREGLAMALSIEDNLALAHLGDFRRVERLPLPSPSKIRAFATSIGGRLKLVAGGFDHSPRTLSGGNQQKLLFGRWLGRPIRLLLVDEPTRGVDIGAKAEIHAQMRKLTASGAAILMATSDIEELLAISDRVLVLCAGKLVAELSGPTLERHNVVAAAFGHAPAEPAGSEHAA